MRLSAGSDRLTVLHVATISKPITPRLGYGPIESVIGNLDKGLTALGHRSIVACSGDSHVEGSKWATLPESLGDYHREGTPAGRAAVALHLARALDRARRGDVDVVHMHQWLDHVDDRRFDPPAPIVMTLHVPAGSCGIGLRADSGVGAPRRAPVHFVAISDFQRREYASRLTTAATVHHGLDTAAFPFQERRDETSYLFSIARITRVKGQDTAIEVGRRSGSKLILAGCVQDKADDRAFFEEVKRSVDLVVDVSREPVDPHYYKRVVRPILDRPERIIYVGELDSEAKKHWYRGARATLFPVRWGEPFGMVLIESLACGTPVLAFREGAVPEIVTHGATGLVVASLVDMVDAVGSIGDLDRRRCRADVVARFSLEKMAGGYVRLYESLAASRSRQRVPILAQEGVGARID